MRLPCFCPQKLVLVVEDSSNQRTDNDEPDGSVGFVRFVVGKAEKDSVDTALCIAESVVVDVRFEPCDEILELSLDLDGDLEGIEAMS